MNIGTAECGRYVLDWERLLREVRQAQDEIYTRTARHACVVDLHPADAKAIAAGMRWQDDAAPVTAIAGVPVILNDSFIRRRGVAQILQCELPHQSPQDCPYHARTNRRLTSRDIPVSIDLPRPGQG